MEKKAKKAIKKKAVKKAVKKLAKKKTAKKDAKKVINTAYKKVSKKQAERLSPEEVIILEDSGMSLKEYNIFARRNGIVPIEEIKALAPEGKTINLQGTARIVTKMTAYGRQQAEADAQAKDEQTTPQTAKYKLTQEQAGSLNRMNESMLNRVRRIQPLPAALRQDTLCLSPESSCACPLCAPKPEYKSRTARAVAAIRHTASNAWAWFENMMSPWGV